MTDSDAAHVMPMAGRPHTVVAVTGFYHRQDFIKLYRID